MIRKAACLIAVFLAVSVAPNAQAQWTTQWQAPIVVAPQPVVVTNRPVVTHVHRPPVVVYHPKRVYTRYRPILGGTVVRTRPGYHRVVW